MVDLNKIQLKIIIAGESEACKVEFDEETSVRDFATCAPLFTRMCSASATLKARISDTQKFC